MATEHRLQEPTRAEIAALAGPTLLEFGTSWCGHCARARPMIHEALEDHPDVRHVRIEDGKGYPLGRSYQVTLWPTLVFLKDGKEIARLVRPGDVRDIEDALERLA
ncbi:thiol reductase thioredoxin [Betaproteobacteria bacterium GR16-43]|nr:thiol reductase thioredoxin [Betaproteobacteria bacterium GR16-43]